ncbi:MAG: peptide chain release factor N(5)-glutamine methyltransferase [Bryobacterales bacterium]|nr:peptide chain release factor N(5)-glutamine methyltransferase [Bryobacterales bacterium]
MHVADALRGAAGRLAEAGVEQPRRSAELLLAEALGWDRVRLITHPEAEIGAEARTRFERDVERRAAGEPLQYILGRQEFYGLDFAVGPGVLIPRPETELLVEQALGRLRAGDKVCDVGVGSGAIAVAIAVERADVEMFGVDFSPTALEVSRENVRRHGARVNLCRSDLLSAFGAATLNMAVSNPPYVAEAVRGDLQRELTFEPQEALFAGLDGLDCYRRLIPQAARVLKPGGSLLLELGHDSLPGVSALLADGPWAPPEVFADLAGIARVIAASRVAS